MKILAIALTAFLLVSSTVILYRKAHQATLAPIEPTAPLVFRKKAPTKNLYLELPLGASISGPLRNRKLAHVVFPEYPEWAEREGITVQVSAKICVRPSGDVSSLIQMTRMSTEQRLDVLAVDALRQWRFSKAPASIGDQWGIVTFHFKLLHRRPSGALTVKVMGPILEVS